MPKKADIIAALEKCMSETGCEGCPYDGRCAEVSNALDRDILTLLNTPTAHLAYCPNCGAAVEVEG